MTAATAVAPGAPPRVVRAATPMRAVAGDIAAMKKIAIPIVAELGRHLGAGVRPAPAALVAAMAAQLADEHRHASLCATVAGDDPGSSAPLPPHAHAFARIVDGICVGPARAYLLCVSAALCTAVETVAFRQLVRAAGHLRGAAVLETLARDEEKHFRLVTGPIADYLDQTGAPRRRARALTLVLALALVTLGSWWPGQLAAYRGLGLDVPRFVRDLGQTLGQALRRFGVFFPRRLFVIGATAWLTVCGWRRTGETT